MQGVTACYEHSNLFKVSDRVARHAQKLLRRNSKVLPCPDSKNNTNPTTSFLTATALIYTIGAGITAAAGTRLALQSFLDKACTLFSFQLVSAMPSPSLLFVTTSKCLDWVICAPAAFLRSGGHLSGPLSGIKPSFAVTRHHHGRPLSYHRQLIGQKFE